MLASTTHPYDDRQNAGIVATALHLGSALRVLDVTGSLRAGTSALATALAAGPASAGGGGASTAWPRPRARRRCTTATAPRRCWSGDGEPIARLVAAHSETVDFVHQYRGHDRAHDYAWEERWIRDEGYMKIVPRRAGCAVRGCLGNRSVVGDALLHAVHAAARGGRGSQSASACRRRGARQSRRGVRRHRRCAPAADAARTRCRRPSPATAFWWRLSARAAMRCCSRSPTRSPSCRRARACKGALAAPQGGDELRALPRLQRPHHARARHARGSRPGHAVVHALPQPRHDHRAWSAGAAATAARCNSRAGATA